MVILYVKTEKTSMSIEHGGLSEWKRFDVLRWNVFYID